MEVARRMETREKKTTSEVKRVQCLTRRDQRRPLGGAQANGLASRRPAGGPATPVESVAPPPNPPSVGPQRVHGRPALATPVSPPRPKHPTHEQSRLILPAPLPRLPQGRRLSIKPVSTHPALSPLPGPRQSSQRPAAHSRLLCLALRMGLTPITLVLTANHRRRRPRRSAAQLPGSGLGCRLAYRSTKTRPSATRAVPKSRCVWPPPQPSKILRRAAHATLSLGLLDQACSVAVHNRHHAGNRTAASLGMRSRVWRHRANPPI